MDVLELARSNGVILLSLLPHTTHRLQPLDVGFYKPLQTYYDRYIERWLRFQVTPSPNTKLGKLLRKRTVKQHQWKLLQMPSGNVPSGYSTTKYFMMLISLHQ